MGAATHPAQFQERQEILVHLERCSLTAKEVNMSRKRREYRLFRRRGSKVWYYDIRLDGGRWRGSTGQRDLRAAHQEAREKVEEILTRRNAGRDAALTKVYARMVAEKKGMGKRDGYVRKLIQHGRDYIIPFFGAGRLVGTIRDHEVEDFKAHLLASLKVGTVNRILTSLRQVFKYADLHGVCRSPRLPKNVPSSIHEEIEKWQILPAEEIQKVLSLVDEEARPALVFIANTGCRIGMAPALRRSMCDLGDPRRPRVHFPASVMKGRKKLTVDLNEAALKALLLGLALHGDQPFPLRTWKLRKFWNHARKTAGHPTLRVHDLRHSRISLLLQHQVPPHVVRDMVGHCSLVVTNLYAHSTDDARRRAARTVSVEVGLDSEKGKGTVGGTVGENEADLKPMPAPRKPKKRMAPRGVTSSGGHMPRDRIELPTRGFSVPCSTG